MSCQVCEETPITTYVRVGNGNVLIQGCEHHLRQLLDQNRAGMAALSPQLQPKPDKGNDATPAKPNHPDTHERRGDFDIKKGA